MELKRVGVRFDRVRVDLNENFDKIEGKYKGLQKRFDNAVDEVADKAFDKVVDRAKIDWLPPVDTFDDLATTYPDATEGQTVMTRDTGKVYRMTNGVWMEIQDIDPTAVNEVDTRLKAELAKTNGNIGDMSVLGTDPRPLTQSITDIGINVVSEGADPTGQVDSTAAINRAISRGTYRVYVPAGEFKVNTKNSEHPGIAILLRDNLLFYGPGIIKVDEEDKDGTSVLGNKSGTSIKNCTVEGIKIDGSDDGTSSRWRANSILYSAENCHFKGVTSINSPYVGLMMRGVGGKRNSFTDCLVDSSRYIGIQAANNEGIIISRCQVYNSGDNGIDIEGNDSSTAQIGLGNKVIIANNIVDIALNAVFIESTGQTIITGNHLYRAQRHGIFVNRINSASFYNTIADNHLVDNGSGVYAALLFNNHVGRSMVHHNSIRGSKDGISAVFANYMDINHNYFSEIDRYLIDINRAQNGLVRSVVESNRYEGSQAEGFPKTFPPIEESSEYKDRAWRVVKRPTDSLADGTPLRDAFHKATQTSPNPGWSNHHVVFYGGETLIFCRDGLDINDNLLIKSINYRVHDNPTPGVYAIRKDGRAGDYRSELNVDSANQIRAWSDREAFAIQND